MIIALLTIITIYFFVFLIWFIGGINLDELKITGMYKAQEICGNNKVIEQGYQRSILSGFGGRRWYQCNMDGKWFEFSIARRINNSQPQVYGFTQKTIFSNNFNITN